MAHKVSVFYQNVRGLRTKAAEFMSNLVGSPHNIFCLSETWLCNNIPDTNYFTPKFNVYRRDRDYACTGQKLGGGVLIACEVSVDSHRRFDLESYPECVWVEIKASDGFNYLIGTYYFAPLSDQTVFIEHFETIRKQINFDKYRVQIYGDFNLPGVDWALQTVNSNSITANKASSLLSFINFCGLEQHNTIKNSVGNVLDLALSNIPILKLSTAFDPLVQIDVFHPPFIVQFYLPFRSRVSCMPSNYCFSKGDYMGVYRFIENFDWCNVLAMSDVDRVSETLTSVVKDAIDSFVPKRTNKLSIYPNWFSKELKVYLRKKEHFHRLFKNTGSTLWYTKFSIYRALAKKLFKRDKRLHRDSVENSLSRRPKMFWQFVKHHTRDISQGICLRDDVVNTPAYHSSPDEVANIFADYFSKCYSSCHQSFQPGDDKISCHDFLHSVRVDHVEIAEAIRKLKPKFSSGVDGIPSFIIKGCGDLFIPILKHIFNLSLSSGVFPSLWKKSVIVPILKSGDASVVTNYRPVSLLCGFSKVFEIVVHTRMLFYFRQKLTPLQHGFLSGRSVQTNLCSFLDFCAPCVLNRGQVDTIYFDMTKAFDKVSHKLLLHKLFLYGLSPKLCEWFQSYLSLRPNSVRVVDSYSYSYFSTSGVPQGSILGPLLFLIFINDIVSCVQSSQLLLFADDIKLFKMIHSPVDCDILQRDVSCISQWCEQNLLMLNPAKTKVLSLCRRHVLFNFTYHLDIMPIERVLCVKDLGVFIDSALSFRNHVSFVVGSSMRVLGTISRLTKNFRKPYCLLQLYKSLVRSRLEFASVIWNSISKTQAMTIEHVQKRLIRIVYDRYFERRCYYNYEYILRSFSLTPLSDRRTIHDFVFLHKVVNGVIDSPPLLSKVNFHVNFRNTRHLVCFDVRSPCCTSPLSRIQTLYNSIAPVHLDFCTSISLYRLQLNSLAIY